MICTAPTFDQSVLAELLERLSLKGRPVAVLGAGSSGMAAAGLLRGMGLEPRLYDEASSLADRADFGLEEASGHDLVVLSPGFHPDHRWLKAAREAGCNCIGELDLAATQWRGRIVAVTGTNGKTTVTELLAFALRAQGHVAVAVGNNGFAFSRLAEVPNHPNAIAVCEVSSFQAETLQHFWADSVLWTHFAEDHLDRYPAMREYFAAKLRVVERLRAPQLWVAPDVAAAAAALGSELPTFAQVVPPETAEAVPVSDHSPFRHPPQRGNLALVAAWWAAEGLPLEALGEAVARFQVPSHRLQPLASQAGRTWWDDSKATNFSAAEAALRRFGKPVIWIAGGRSKGGDIDAFVGRCAERVAWALLIGSTAVELERACLRRGVSATVCGTLEAAVRRAAEISIGASDVLLSPGFASQDQFMDYRHRGRHFREAVLRLSPSAGNG